MAYLEQSNWRNRPGAIAAAIAIHAGIGLVLVQSLDFVRVVIEDPPFVGVSIEAEEVPAPPTDDIVPPDNTPTETIEYAPKPPIDVTPTGPIVVPLPPLELPVDLTPKPRPSLTPSLGFDPIGAKPINSPAGWVTTNDYPAGDIRQEHEGVAGFRVVVGTDGRVKSCEITSSSGFAGLDLATCRNVERRARFDAAKDADGNKVVGTYSNKVLWQIPD